MKQTLLESAVNDIGKMHLASKLDISFQYIDTWIKKGHLPFCEFTGKTNYAKSIERLTKNKYTEYQLLNETIKKITHNKFSLEKI